MENKFKFGLIMISILIIVLSVYSYMDWRRVSLNEAKWCQTDFDCIPYCGEIGQMTVNLEKKGDVDVYYGAGTCVNRNFAMNYIFDYGESICCGCQTNPMFKHENDCNMCICGTNTEKGKRECVTIKVDESSC